MTATDRLRAALECCSALCDPLYARADAEALRQQRRHRAIVRVIAIAGTIGILAGIAPLAAQLGGDAAKIVEALSALTALVAVALGIYLRSQRAWLLARHRAERVRVLQYRALIALAADRSADLARWESELSRGVAGIERLTGPDMHAWLAREEPMRVERCDDPDCEEAVAELAAFYAAGRLREQCEYFRARAERNERTGRLLQHVSAPLFFLSVFAVLPASLIRIFGGPEAVAVVFVWIAAGLPALAAGIRVFRSAHEFSRNGARFRAKYVALSGLREQLARGSDVARLVSDLQHAELLLEAEHREWLRLMRAADWY